MESGESIADLHKVCTGCGQALPLSAFWKQKPGKYGRQAKCKPCQTVVKTRTRAKKLDEYRAKDRIAQATAYAANPGKYRAKSRAFAAKNPEKVYASIRNSEAKKPEKYRALDRAKTRHYLLRQYGLTAETFDTLMARQNGRCPICTQMLCPGSATHIDHDHDSGAVRGLLCRTCNQGIGLLRESVENLERAIAYLRT